MAKARKVRKARKPTGREIIEDINALVDARINSGLERLKVSSSKSLERGIKQALRTPDIPTKKDIEKIKIKIASMDMKLNKLIMKKRAKVATTKPGKKKVKKICKVKGCNLPYRSKGYCEKHYQAWRKGKLGKSKVVGVKVCKVKGCRNKHHAKGYCWNHYMKLRRGTLK